MSEGILDVAVRLVTATALGTRRQHMKLRVVPGVAHVSRRGVHRLCGVRVGVGRKASDLITITRSSPHRLDRILDSLGIVCDWRAHYPCVTFPPKQGLQPKRLMFKPLAIHEMDGEAILSGQIRFVSGEDPLVSHTNLPIEKVDKLLYAFRIESDWRREFPGVEIES